MTNYVEKRNEAYWIAGSRVSLDSVIYAFLEGSSPETIVDSFDTLSLEQVYGAITYYLSHRSEVDAYLEKRRVRLRRTLPASPRIQPLAVSEAGSVKATSRS